MAKIELPDKVFGKEVKGAMERVLSSQQPVQDIQPIMSSTSFDIKGSMPYIQVGINGLYGKPVAISRFELPGYNNTKWEKEHFKLHENGLYMPTPSIFMKHFKNVVDAFNNNKTLYYANNSPVSKDDIKDIYLHLTKDHIAIYGSNPGAWTWLNARFVKGSGFNNLDLETVIGANKNTLIRREEPLEQCLFEDSYAEIEFNSQGLAVKKYKDDSYKQGKNIKFWYPRKDAVARFLADSDGADLNCLRDPDYSYSGLGVFGCAEGASTPKN